ncbi:plasmid mobilization relaxosome protein MobC [Streptomyces sp. NPDC001089]
MEKKRPARRRQRDVGSSSPRRTHRVNLAYNDSELQILSAAAARAGLAPAAWAAEAALAVATEAVVPVPADSKEVLAEFIKARNQVSRIGNNANQIARALNSDGTVEGSQLAAVLDAVRKAIKRIDDATLQVMRERRPRS